MDMSSDFWWSVSTIVAGSYLVEDAAAAGAVAAHVSGKLPMLVAWFALFIGLFTGDVLLYMVGWRAHRQRWLRYRLLRIARVRRLRIRLRSHLIVSVVIARIVPGLRTASYLLCGALRLRPLAFLATVAVATAIWSAGLFYSGHLLAGFLTNLDAVAIALVVVTGLFVMGGAASLLSRRLWR